MSGSHRGLGRATGPSTHQCQEIQNDDDFASGGFATFHGSDDYQYLSGVVLDGDDSFVAFGGRDTGSNLKKQMNEAFVLDGDITTSSDDGGSGGVGGLLAPLTLLTLGLLPLFGHRPGAA